jgi:hypothetical protein
MMYRQWAGRPAPLMHWHPPLLLLLLSMWHQEEAHMALIQTAVRALRHCGGLQQATDTAQHLSSS